MWIYMANISRNRKYTHQITFGIYNIYIKKLCRNPFHTKNKHAIVAIFKSIYSNQHPIGINNCLEIVKCLSL